MAKALDYFSLSFLLMITTFTIFALVFDNLLFALIVSSAFCVAVVLFLKSITRKKYKYNPQLLATEFCIQGNEYAAKLIASTLKTAEIENSSNYIFLKNCIIVSLFKFGTISSQDVATIAKTAKSRKITVVYALGYGIDRKAYQVANYAGIRLKLVKINAVYRFLDKHGALPDLSKKKQKTSLSEIFETAFAKGNLKYYAFSGAVLIATSFITPLKIYYIVSGSISLLLAFFCLAFGNGNLHSQNPFKELESAADCDCAKVVDDSRSIENNRPLDESTSDSNTSNEHED